jgi:hypothetical protein
MSHYLEVISQYSSKFGDSLKEICSQLQQK